MNKVYIFFLSVLLFISCKDEKLNNNTEGRDLLQSSSNSLFSESGDFLKVVPGTERVGYATVSKLYSDFKVIKLGDPSQVMIGTISKVIPENNRYYILDAKTNPGLFVFDEQGSFQFQIGKKGEAPGEYDMPIDFCVADSLVYILDRQMRLFSYEKNSGRFKKSIKLPFICGQVFSLEGDILGFSTNQPFGSEEKNHLLFLKNDTVVSKNIPFVYEALGNLGAYPIGNSNRKNVYFFGRPYGDEIFEISNKGISRKLKFDFGNDNLPEKVMKDAQMLIQAMGDRNSQYKFLFPTPILETDSLVVVRCFNSFIRTFFIRKTDLSNQSYSGIRDDVFHGGLYDFPIQVKGNDLISVIQPEPIIRYFKVLMQSKEDADSYRKEKKQLFDVFTTLKEDDNPLLLISKFKN
jgi:hypothetical protein